MISSGSGGSRPFIYVPIAEILKISTFEGYVHLAAATLLPLPEPIPKIDWRKVKTEDSAVFSTFRTG